MKTYGIRNKANLEYSLYSAVSVAQVLSCRLARVDPRSWPWTPCCEVVLVDKLFNLPMTQLLGYDS